MEKTMREKFLHPPNTQNPKMENPLDPLIRAFIMSNFFTSSFFRWWWVGKLRKTTRGNHCSSQLGFTAKKYSQLTLKLLLNYLKHVSLVNCLCKSKLDDCIKNYRKQITTKGKKFFDSAGTKDIELQCLEQEMTKLSSGKKIVVPNI